MDFRCRANDLRAPVRMKDENVRLGAAMDKANTTNASKI